MDKRNNPPSRRGGPVQPEHRLILQRFRRKRYHMNRCIVASILSLGLSSCLSSQALAADITPPIISAKVIGAQGTNGWYTSNVSVTWSVTDAQSAITQKTGCTNSFLTADTLNKTYTCIATSQGGTSKKSIIVKRDTTPPKAVIVTPVSGASYTQNKIIKASYSCTDWMSKIATCTGTVANGASINTSTPGQKTFSVKATDLAGNTSNISRSYIVLSPPIAKINGTYLFAWNDLGMHCADSDFSIFTLLPPFNDLSAQLVVNGKLVSTANNSSYKLTYIATADTKGSINSSSANKTNFWKYDKLLFGADLPPNVGLTGNPTASYIPAPLTWNDTFKWYEATGVPITPIDDNMKENYFPMVKVVAKDSTGKAIATSNAVLPVSSEINCFSCHASTTGSAAAKPAAGWVNLTSGSERDWRLNILRLHDEKNAGPDYTALLTRMGFGKSLESSAFTNGKPVLCDTCHNSNALAVWGINGEKGISNMTAAMHNRHANTSLPGSTQTLDSIGTRVSCYNCHPGKKTECLRGAMGNPVNASTGKHIMECQSCHGSMTTVGKVARNGWFDMPTCQSCHHDGKRDTVAINADGTFKTTTDTRFASNPNTPTTGASLFRFSTGHGKLQCEACHNSTHAEFTSVPSANGNQVNDNQQAIKAQGYAASIRECLVCHTTMPNTASGGPHGLHSIGQSWVAGHEEVSKSTCSYCHGTTSSGSPLAVIKVKKTFNIDDGRTKTFAVNERVTCWSCHNGPNP